MSAHVSIWGYSSVYSLSLGSHMLEGLYLNYGMSKIREKQEQTVEMAHLKGSLLSRLTVNLGNDFFFLHCFWWFSVFLHLTGTVFVNDWACF